MVRLFEVAAPASFFFFFLIFPFLCVAVWYSIWAFQVVQWSRICLPMQETRVQSLCQEDPLVEEMATHSSILVWKIPWTEVPGGL